MTRIVLDTNVVLSFLTDRDPRQQAAAAELFEQTAAGEKELVLHQIVSTELVYVLHNHYRVGGAETAATLRDLLALPGVLSVDSMPWPTLFDLWPAHVPEFADAVLAAVTKVGRHDALATFDTAFRRRLRRLGLTSYW
jgi:predicted nucleic acid-binding protein